MKVDFGNTEIAFRSQSDWDLKRSAFIFELLNFPIVVRLGAVLARIALFLHLPVRALIRATIFRQFCGGETLQESLEKAKRLSRFGVQTILDVAVEGSQTERIFEDAMQEILRTIQLSAKEDFLPFGVVKLTGIAASELLEKQQNQNTLTNIELKAWAKAKERLLNLCQNAYNLNVPFLIDAEETWIQTCIDSLAEEMMERFNKKETLIFNTIQMYRKDRLEYLKDSIEKAKKGKYFLGVKVVRGAYLEKERMRAIEKGYPSPLFETKEATDAAYNSALKLCIENRDTVSIVAGTHNEHSTQLLIDLMEQNGISRNDKRIFFSQLFGMSDPISFHLAEKGYHVAKYLPYGDVRILLPYLIRRAQENSAVHGQTPRELALLKKEIQRRQGATKRVIESS